MPETDGGHDAVLRGVIQAGFQAGRVRRGGLPSASAKAKLDVPGLEAQQIDLYATEGQLARVNTREPTGGGLSSAIDGPRQLGSVVGGYISDRDIEEIFG